MPRNTEVFMRHFAYGPHEKYSLPTNNDTRCLKKYPVLIGNRIEAIRYYSPSGQLNLSIFNLDSHTLHLNIVHQTPEIQACKVKIYIAPETRGFREGPSHDLISHIKMNAKQRYRRVFIIRLIFTQVTGMNILQMMKTWTLQMGHPLINITIDPTDKTKATATQQHFLLDPKAVVKEKSPYKYVFIFSIKGAGSRNRKQTCHF